MNKIIVLEEINEVVEEFEKGEELKSLLSWKFDDEDERKECFKGVMDYYGINMDKEKGYYVEYSMFDLIIYYEDEKGVEKGICGEIWSDDGGVYGYEISNKNWNCLGIVHRWDDKDYLENETERVKTGMSFFGKFMGRDYKIVIF